MVFEQDFKPKSGFICIIMIIVPTPFIKPDITGYGTYLTISVSFVRASSIWKNPAISIIIITEFISLFKACITDAITIAEGPVIPEIIGTFVPKIPAMKQRIIAPQIPALAPKPVATPKASA